jgi:hypothetical protein
MSFIFQTRGLEIMLVAKGFDRKKSMNMLETTPFSQNYYPNGTKFTSILNPSISTKDDFTFVEQLSETN